MMQTLYLIRHTTPRIEPGICYGQLDVDVTDSFEEEARRIRQWLPPVGLVFTSPLLRARRLGEYLAKQRRCELRSDARLMEKHFGEWEGKAWDDIPHSEVDAWAADILGYVPAGGESVEQLTQRVRSFLNAISLLPQQGIVIVAHAGSIRAVLASISGVPLADTLKWQVEYGTVIGVRTRACLQQGDR
jgi:alpha-ribazole phosphatase